MPKSGAKTPTISAPGGDLVIRPAVVADCERIVALVQALAAHVGDAKLATVTPEALRAAASGERPLWQGMVAEVPSGEIVGICIYSFLFSTWVGAPGIYVIDLYVRNEFRRSQLGRRLLAAAARRARADGARFVRLEVDGRNMGAEGFYLRLGFQKIVDDRIYLLKAAAFDALADG